MMNTVSATWTISRERLAQHIQETRQRLEQPEARSVLLALCGGSDTILDAFKAARGVQIGRFSNALGLPVTTVRHYIELGLVNPFVLNNKFYFSPVCVAQVMHVQRWQELGLSLEEIRERRKSAGANTLLLEALGDGRVVQVQRTGAASRQDQIAFGQPNPFPSALSLEVRMALHHEYTAVVERLESQRLELDRKLEQARTLRDSVAQ